MKKIKEYKFRKCTDINLDLPFFEVLDKSDSILLDISKDNNGEFQILFHSDSSSKYISIELLEQILNEAKELIEKEE